MSKDLPRISPECVKEIHKIFYLLQHLTVFIYLYYLNLIISYLVYLYFFPHINKHNTFALLIAMYISILIYKYSDYVRQYKSALLQCSGIVFFKRLSSLGIFKKNLIGKWHYKLEEDRKKSDYTIKLWFGYIY